MDRTDEGQDAPPDRARHEVHLRRSGEPGPAGLTQTAPHAGLAVATAPGGKSGRTRYLRQFPERLFFLLDRLNEREFVAAQRLSLEFVITDGDLQADDKHLAMVTKLSPKNWAALRDKLLQLGLGRIEHGFWVDDDQLASLEIQRAASRRGAAGGLQAAANRRQRHAA